MRIELATQHATSVGNGVTWALLRNAMLHGGNRMLDVFSERRLSQKIVLLEWKLLLLLLLLLQLLTLLLLSKWMSCGCVCGCFHECFL